MAWMWVRLWNAGVVLFWLASMSVLFVRDILPTWMAGDPPPAIALDGMGPGHANSQAGIFRADGQRIGTNWLRFYTPVDDQLTVKSTTFVSGLPLVPPLRIVSRFTFRDQGVLDNFDMSILGAPLPIRIKGENYDPDFPCELTMGDETFRWRMDAKTSRMLAETFRPFMRLPGLHVGRSWRMRVVDPLATVTRGAGQFNVVLVRVTRKETIQHEGESVECFRVEAPQLVAFVTNDGRVLRQEIEVPVFGRFVILSEPFDKDSLRKAEDRVPLWKVPARTQKAKGASGTSSGRGPAATNDAPTQDS